MQINFYFISKLFLLFYVWILIAFCILFILNSRRICFNLKEFEKKCIQRKREVVHNFLPLVFNLAKKNESLKTVLNLNKYNLKDYFLSVFPLFFQGYIFYQWVRTSFNLTRRALR